MANVCTNLIHCSTKNESNYKTIEEFISDNYEPGFITGEEGRFFEGEFNTKWSFPESDFEELISQLEPDDTLYIRILSYEFSSEYVSLRFFRNGEWDVKV